MNRSTTLLLTLILTLVLAPLPSAAQTTFTVTVAPKTQAHPEFGEGWTEGYVIDGVEGKEVVLTRGTTYTFQMSSVPEMHPFYITTSPSGASQTPYTEGVTGNMATGNSVVTFTPSASTPDLLYYQCGFHTNMGWRIVVQSAAGVDATSAAEAASLAVVPNPVDAAASVTLRSPRTGTVRVVAHDMLGREALELYSGAVSAGEELLLSLDGSSLASGIYEIRASGAGINATARLVKTR